MKRYLTILLLLPFAAFAQITVAWNGGDQGSTIQTALSNAGFGGYVLLAPGKVYQSSTQIKVPNGVTLEGQGATLKPMSSLPTGTSYFVTTAAATLHSATSQAIAVTAGGTTFTYANAAKATAGDIVELRGPEYYRNPVDNVPYMYGYYITSAGFSGSTVTVTNPFPASFTASSIYVYKAGTNIHIKNLVLDMAGRTGGGGVQLYHATNSSIENVIVAGTLPAPVDGLFTGINVQGVGNTVSHCRAFGMDATSVGYGISAIGDNNLVTHCAGWANRHTIASASRATISTRIVYEFDSAFVSNTGASTEQQMDLHANAQHCRIENCYVVIGGMANTGIQIRGRYDTAQYNTVIMNNTGNQWLYAFSFHENPYYSIAQYNTIIVSGGGNNRYVGSGNIYGTPVGAQFINNVVSTATSSAPGWLALANNTTNGTIVVPVDTTSIVTEPPPPADTCDCWKLVRFK